MNNYNRLETISTVCWLLMDFCWMSTWNTAALIVGIASIVFSYLALEAYKEDKLSEKLLLGANFVWIVMNTSWMLGDTTGKPFMITIAKGLFVISLIMVGLAFYFSSKNNEKLTFKRFRL